MKKKCCGTCRFRAYNGSCEYEPVLPFWAYDAEFRSEWNAGRFLDEDAGENCDAYEAEIDWSEYEKMGE